MAGMQGRGGGATILRSKGQGNKIDPCKLDFMASLSDELLLRILVLLPSSPYPCSQVCQRWLRLHGSLRHSATILDWSFLTSGRFSVRFPNLTRIDLYPACLPASTSSSSSPVILSHHRLSLHLPLHAFHPPSINQFILRHQLSPSALDSGLKLLADLCPGLQKLSVVDVRPAASHDPAFFPPKTHKLNGFLDVSDSQDHDIEDGGGDQDPYTARLPTSPNSDTPLSDQGLAYIAKNCPTLQDLELHQCTDDSLSAISACKNLQIVRLVGTVDGFYHCTFTDIGLTILARSCNRLVKLELSGCEASYDGIAAIGQCCFMLEELTLSNQGFYDGWVAALSFCSCLKTLRLENCKQIDPAPGPLEHLGHCMALERLQLVRCDLRDEAGFHALMLISMNIRELEIQDCWGLEDETFAVATACRRVKLLALEGCSLLTTAGLEAVVLAWKDLQALRVVYCNNVKDSEISPALALHFCILKELKWRPDAKSLLSMSLAGTGMGQQGGKFFKKGGPS